jgi:class 3 adenylate cyclase
MALDMRAYLQTRPPYKGIRIEMRIGINSGSVIGGVVGHQKFHYDVWGDAVNVASRMESHGVPGEIQITEATYALIKDSFDCRRRGVVAVKGKGEMVTWFLDGRTG